MKSQKTLIQEFVDGATDGEASHMYIDGDVMYSYGRHFPLLVRRDWGFLLNADKYSSTTSQHQSSCFKHATIQIPFSALNGAGISYYTFELVTHQPQRWDTVAYRQANTDDRISLAEYEKLTTEQQEGYYPVEERRPESAVIKHKDKYYLSSMDGYNYFICLLPDDWRTDKPFESIEGAFDALMPEQVKGQEYQRQGEWFFVPMGEPPIFISESDEPLTPEKMNKFLYKAMTPKFTLPHRPDGNLHIATRGMQIGDRIWVSGQVRHQSRWGGRGDHRMMRLSTSDQPLIFEAFENRAQGSWSASGRVD
jgi:hypothetical protein